MPFFSIITATHNAERHLPDLLESLATQTCKEFELVLQDAKSSDGTLEILDAYSNRIASLSVVSEPDTGIYDAWNKALLRAGGEWILFLGADDTLVSDTTLSTVKHALETCPDGVLFACGDLDLLKSDGERKETLLSRVDEAQALLCAGLMPAGHPAMFHHRSLFKATQFDITFQIAADYEFLCRLWTPAVKAVNLGLPVTRMGAGGISQTPRAVWRTRWEVFRILRRHFPSEGAFHCHALPLAKGLLVACACCLFGEKRAATLLDRFREMRGLSRVWTDIVGR